jgi:hypothetical protein
MSKPEHPITESKMNKYILDTRKNIAKKPKILEKILTYLKPSIKHRLKRINIAMNKSCHS